MNQFSLYFSSSEQDGSHWFAILRIFEAYEVFDSLGTNNAFIRAKLGSLRGKFIFNATAVQPPYSKSCGLFCCYFAILRLLNLDLTFSEVHFILLFTSATKSIPSHFFPGGQHNLYLQPVGKWAKSHQFFSRWAYTKSILALTWSSSQCHLISWKSRLQPESWLQGLP